MPKLNNIEEYLGKKFNRLTIAYDLGILHKNTYGRSVLAVCDCGDIKEYFLSVIKNGEVKSCGCLRSELSAQRKITHGLYGHPIYKLWYLVKYRCYDKHDSGYKNYGAKGVTMCEEWKNNFISFYNWCILNGWQKGLQLDKDKLSPYKTGKMYSPELCCFLTSKQNMMHRSNSVEATYRGQTKNLSEWVSILGLDYKLIKDRYKKGWETTRNFETPCIVKYRNKSAI